jgi:hypothetical protein
MKGVRRKTPIPPQQKHRDRKNDYQRQEKHKKLLTE